MFVFAAKDCKNCRPSSFNNNLEFDSSGVTSGIMRRENCTLAVVSCAADIGAAAAAAFVVAADGIIVESKLPLLWLAPYCAVITSLLILLFDACACCDVSALLSAQTIAATNAMPNKHARVSIVTLRLMQRVVCAAIALFFYFFCRKIQKTKNWRQITFLPVTAKTKTSK